MGSRSSSPLTVAAPPPAATAAPDVAAYVAALTAWLAAASLAFVQRGDALRCLVLASLSPTPTNVLFTGPPGTAKTAMIAAFAASLRARFLDRTLSAWTDDAALLGPVDVAALASGVMRRVVGGAVVTLADAEIVHVDELPRGGRGVRDLLLSAFADRVTPDGVPVPAHVIVASANTRLVDEDDRALVDRFALRVDVPRVAGHGDLRAVITRRVSVGGRPAVSSARLSLPTIPTDAIAVLRAHADTVDLPDDVADALTKCALTLRSSPPSGIAFPDVSERRWVAATGLLQASAVLAGRTSITFDDLITVLPFALDDGPDSRAGIRHAIDSCVPAYVAALANVRAECTKAVERARKVTTKVPLAPGEADLHLKRENVLRALVDTVASHGKGPRDEAEAAILDTLDAIDDMERAAVVATPRRGRSS